MIIIEKSLKNMVPSIVSFYLLTTLVLGGSYLLYATKPLPTTYEYEKALQEAIQSSHIAKLTISPTISYGGTGDNSLRKITHTIQLLSESKTNKGLVIDLAPCDKARKDEQEELERLGFVNYTILKDALQAYKAKTNRKIIVHVTNRLAVPFLIILAIADQVILDTTTISENTYDHFFLDIALYTDPVFSNNIVAYILTVNQKKDSKDTIELYAGDYKLGDDPKEAKKRHNEFKSAIGVAVTRFEKIRGPFPAISSKQSLCTYLADYGSGKRPEEVEAYIKAQIEQVPIIDLNPCVNGKHTLEYTPQNRSAHRRTEACFETIMISGEIDPTLVKKISPLIQSVHCDPNIKGVIIVWDSPGGEVPSVKQLLRLLQKLDAAKPIIHVATFQCVSGAYLLAAGTGKYLTAYPNAQLGSMGARCELDLPITYTDMENTRQSLEETRQWMIQVIAQNRAKILGVNQKAYRQKLSDTEARTYIATRAEEEQLIDEIGTLQNAIDALKAYTGLDLPVYYSENETQLINV